MSTTTTTEVIELQPIPFTATPNSPRPKHTPEQSHGFVERDNRNYPSASIEDATGTVPAETPALSKLQLVMTISQLSVSNFFSSFASGIITVGLPVIAESISLQRSLYLWPSSVYSLTSGAALLIAGSVADIIGARGVEVYGVFLLGLFILACGLAQTGTQLVVFRAMQGIALAMHIPAQVSIVAGSVPAGRARNIGFSFLGLSQPLGFSFGMVSSGIMIEKIGWRFGFYLSGGIMLGTAVLSQFTLPRVKAEGEGLSKTDLLRKLWEDVDWIGGSIAGSGLALLSYVLA
jgi:MFS family permease